MPTRTSVAWIFVSHSTKDLDKVRQVRNAMEAAGGQPILFFLKCLSDHDELDGLLKREITARSFFLLCDSENAKASKMVQEEVAHVKSLVGKKIEVIDLDGDWNAQMKGIVRLIRRATVFLSYARSDVPLVRLVQQELVNRDFQVWMDESSLAAGEPWRESIRAAIQRAVQEGYFLQFLSRASARSPWAQEEAEMAFQLGGAESYIPIFLDPPRELLGLLSPRLQDWLSNRHMLDYSDHDFGRLLRDLLHALGLSKNRSEK